MVSRHPQKRFYSQRFRKETPPESIFACAEGNQSSEPRDNRYSGQAQPSYCPILDSYLGPVCTKLNVLILFNGRPSECPNGVLDLSFAPKEY